jgi:hypothetical protein
MYNRPPTPYRKSRKERYEEEQENQVLSIETPISSAKTHSDEEKNVLKDVLAWEKRAPGITRKNATLLTGASLSKKILALDSFMLIEIARYLCGPNQPGKPLEWLIISAMLQSHYPKLGRQSIRLEDQEQQQTSATIFEQYFSNPVKNSPTTTAFTHLNSADVERNLDNRARLFNTIRQESQNLICASATRAAVELTQNDNESQLSMVMLFGTYAEKNIVIYYLMITLFNAYQTCHHNYQTPGMASQLQQNYTETKRYVMFLENHETQKWSDSLPRISEDSFEKRLKERHYNYLRVANSTLRDKVPPSPHHQSAQAGTRQPPKAQSSCSIS